MKKMIVFAAAFVAAVMSQAAQIDWNYTATAAEVDQTVYVLLGSSAVESWESLDALKGKAISSGDISKAGRVYYAQGMATSEALTKSNASIYYVVVSADEKTFSVTSVANMAASVYDPSAQETSPGSNMSLGPGNITKSGIAWGTGTTDPVVPTPTPDVPEPTSGILLLVGGAALALRRKQK